MNNNLQTLQNILEALMTVETKGDSTITMSNVLQALRQTIRDIAVIEQQRADESVAENPAETPEFVIE